MKKYPRIVQADSRGQIVIPKDVRRELGIDEGTGFFMYTITGEGILLKKIDTPELSEHKEILQELAEKAGRVSVSKKNLARSTEAYRKKNQGGFELI